jgi:hypothetical protein
MGNKLASIVALTAALTPALANAIGFGEIALHSRIGEPLMAEVPIVSNSSETPLAACFSMVALRGSDFPVVTAAKPRLIKRGSSYILQIVGDRPISEPVFAIGVRANCGYDFERQYVLMPEPPIELAQAYGGSPTSAAPVRPAGTTSQWLAREGDTLEAIAEARAPNNPAERRRLLAGLKRTNPELESDTPLAEGTIVQMPQVQRKRPAPPPKAAADTALTSASQAEARPPRQAAAPTRQPKAPPAAPAASGGADRLVLGAAAGEPPQPKTAGNSGSTSLTETEERLLKLETTLHRLTQEIEKMDQAIDLATKALEAQSHLQMAQNMQPPAAPAPGVAIQSAAAKPAASSNWLELLLSAAIGAGLSIGMAQFLGRRRRYPGDEEVPLAFSGYRNEATPSLPPRPAEPVTQTPLPEAPALRSTDTPPPLEAVAPPQVEECDIPLQLEPDVIEARSEDEHSVLELAEIMLAFGRLRGAADTLAEHIDQTMPKSFEPWNMLLDLYRRGGMRQEFEELAPKMRIRFNAQIPDWNESSTPISGLKTLEDFPHVIQQACKLWGSQAGVDYLYGLVHDTRAGQRNGFPLEVVEEIALLIRILIDGYDLQRRS